MKLIEKISSLLQAIDNCQRSKNTEWTLKHMDALEKLYRSWFERDEKMKYLVSGHGCQVGAIGIRHRFAQELEADSEQDARLKIYEFYEHLSGIVIQPIDPTPEERNNNGS